MTRPIRRRSRTVDNARVIKCLRSSSFFIAGRHFIIRHGERSTRRRPPQFRLAAAICRLPRTPVFFLLPRPSLASFRNSSGHVILFERRAKSPSTRIPRPPVHCQEAHVRFVRKSFIVVKNKWNKTIRNNQNYIFTVRRESRMGRVRIAPESAPLEYRVCWSLVLLFFFFRREIHHYPSVVGNSRPSLTRKIILRSFKSATKEAQVFGKLLNVPRLCGKLTRRNNAVRYNMVLNYNVHIVFRPRDSWTRVLFK